MKLNITRRGLNLRTRKNEIWEAKSSCGRFIAVRLDDETTWELFDNQNLFDVRVGLFGSLAKCQRHVDLICDLIPIGTRVALIESGATGIVVKHMKARMDDRPHRMTEKVRWDSHGTESYVRPKQLRRI